MIKKTGVVWLGLLLLGAVLVSGCAAPGARVGDTVSVNYTLALDDGTIYDTSIGREPLQFKIGEGKFLPSFEEAVVGMRLGDTKTIRLPPEKAYGPHRPDLVDVVSRSLLPEGVDPMVGQQLEAIGQDGAPFTVVIIEVTEDTVTADANLPLAGKNLTFDIELLAIGENLAADDRANQANLSWLLLAPVALVASGLTFFYFTHRRKRRPVNPARKGPDSRGLHESGHQPVRPARKNAGDMESIRPVSRRVRPAHQSAGLLGELARLDDDFEGGRITEQAYRRARAQKKELLIQLMRQLEKENGSK